MSTILAYRRFGFFFYSNEGTPLEPVHVHVDKDDKEAKFWLLPVVRMAYKDGYDAPTLRDLLTIVESNRSLIERTWNDFFA